MHCLASNDNSAPNDNEQVLVGKNRGNRPRNGRGDGVCAPAHRCLEGAFCGIGAGAVVVVVAAAVVMQVGHSSCSFAHVATEAGFYCCVGLIRCDGEKRVHSTLIVPKNIL